jgi:hypothetical protein
MKSIRQWLKELVGVDKLEQWTEKFRNVVDETYLRSLVGRAVFEAMVENKPDIHGTWGWCHGEKNLAVYSVRALVHEQVKKTVEVEFQKMLLEFNREEFIDKVVERIRRKQLGKINE